MLFNRLDPALLHAIADEAHARKLPITVHTGEAHDVADALAAGTDGVEHGSSRDLIPEALLKQMTERGTFYDPTLSVFAAFRELSQDKSDLLKRSLVRQVAPPELLADTEKFLGSDKSSQMRQQFSKFANQQDFSALNLLHAYNAHVPLIAGSDAGNFLVIHGPTMQRELQLWVAAGVPAETAIQAATYNSARALGASNRIGSITAGHDADLLIVEGDPLQDISSLERISRVIFKGEVINRAELFDQD